MRTTPSNHSPCTSLDSNLFRFQIDGVVAMVLLHGFCGDVAPFVEHVCGIVFQLEGDEFLAVRAVHFFCAAVGEIWVGEVAD